MGENSEFNFTKKNNLQEKLCKKCFNFYSNLKKGFCTKCSMPVKRNYKLDLKICREEKKTEKLFHKKIKKIKINLIQIEHKKCWSCKKKIGIRGFRCRCKYTFCKKHRMPEDHICEFDFIKDGKIKLKKDLTFRLRKIKKI